MAKKSSEISVMTDDIPSCRDDVLSMHICQDGVMYHDIIGTGAYIDGGLGVDLRDTRKKKEKKGRIQPH